MDGLTTAEAGRRADITPYHVRRLISQGKIKAKKLPEKQFDVDPVSLEVYIAMRHKRTKKLHK